MLSEKPLAADTALDATYATAEMAEKLSSHAMYGPPHGRPWKPTNEQLRDHPEIVTLQPHPWAVLSADPPGKK